MNFKLKFILMVIKLIYLNDFDILCSTYNNKNILNCNRLDGIFLKEILRRSKDEVLTNTTALKTRVKSMKQ